MGLSPSAVAANLAFFEHHGGYCDCEVWMNVERSVVFGDPTTGAAEEQPADLPTEDGVRWDRGW